MKPRPPRKPKRIRVTMVYTVPAHAYISLTREAIAISEALANFGSRTVKSNHFELAKWGSGKRGSLPMGNNTNIEKIKLDISCVDKNVNPNLRRYINLSARKP